MTSTQKQKYFLGYLTANDDPTFLIDYLNIKNMIRYHPGVLSISVCIAISSVRDLDKNDRKKIDRMKRLMMKCNHISGVHILVKDNIGRDFSSAESCLNYFSGDINDGDYVMIKNRSGYGPLSDNWYTAYVDQNKKLPDGGLTGSTINQNGHPQRLQNGVPTHVQTYVYLSQWVHFKILKNNFPGSVAMDRLDVIAEGEIGLSHSFLKRGLQINCLHWSEHIFDSDRIFYKELPSFDVKKTVKKLPIHYKYRHYLYRPYSLMDGLKWNCLELLRVTLIKRIKWVFKKIS